MTWDASDVKRYNPIKIADSTIERAKQRLKISTPVQIGDMQWILHGNPEMGDAYDDYNVDTDGLGTFYCSCYSHKGGDIRHNKVCSHSVAVSIHTGYPCYRVEAPLKKKPEPKPAPVQDKAVVSEVKSLEPVTKVPDRPCDIHDIPARYDKWREHQKGTVQWAVDKFNQGTRYIAIDSPTGSGKSLTGISVAKMTGKKCLYLVSTKQLQEQIVNDYPGAVVIWGRDNYPCTRWHNNNELTAADCTHTEDDPCDKIVSCQYKVQKRRALNSQLAVVNYSFFLHETFYVGQFSDWPLAIADEGDILPDEIGKFVELTITRKQLDACGIDPPKYKTKLEAWLDWLQPTLNKVDNQIHIIADSLGELYQPPMDIMREYLLYKRLSSRLTMFQTTVDDTWIGEFAPDRWQFRPTWVNNVAHTLTEQAKQFIIMSGTMPPSNEFAWHLGIQDKIPLMHVPSTFPKENRPLYYRPVADFSYKKVTENDYKALVYEIDELLSEYANQKGIIQTISYKLNSMIMENSVYKNRMITHNDSKSRIQALQTLIESDKPLVLLSPSFTRGVDLFGDRAGFQIICKIPYLDLSDKQTQKRRWSGKKGERWYLNETARTIEQMYGRIYRSKDDCKPTYILDSRWPDFFDSVRGDLQPWFKEACIWKER